MTGRATLTAQTLTANRYATEYAMSGTGLLRTVPGLKTGWAATQGLASAGEFFLHSIGPSLHYFSWGDAQQDPSAPANPFIANLFPLARDVAVTPAQRRLYAYSGRQLLEVRDDCSQMACAFSLLAYSTEGTAADVQQLPTSAFFPVKHVGMFRSGWGAGLVAHDSRTLVEQGGSSEVPAWLGFKGCDGRWTHNDVDGGQWVLEMGGQRWAVDLGADSYGGDLAQTPLLFLSKDHSLTTRS